PIAPDSLNGSPQRFSFLLMSVVLTCLAFLPGARAVTPAPDEAYPNGNTAERSNALLALPPALGTQPLEPVPRTATPRGLGTMSSAFLRSLTIGAITTITP